VRHRSELIRIARALADDPGSIDAIEVSVATLGLRAQPMMDRLERLTYMEEKISS